MIPENERLWIENTLGLINTEEGHALAEAAAGVARHHAIVEIGSHTGLSSLWLAAGAKSGLGAHVFCVDPWPDPGYTNGTDDPFQLGSGDAVLERFLSNIRGVTQEVANVSYEDYVTPIRAESLMLAPSWVQPIGLLFIDALHDYGSVEADYVMWGRHVVRGGWIAFNDYWMDPDRTDLSPTASVIEEVVRPDGWDMESIVWNTWWGRRL